VVEAEKELIGAGLPKEKAEMKNQCPSGSIDSGNSKKDPCGYPV
jgi:hypothetical protein